MQPMAGKTNCNLLAVTCYHSSPQLHSSEIKKLHSPCAIVHKAHKINSLGIHHTVRNTRDCSKPGTSAHPKHDDTPREAAT